MPKAVPGVEGLILCTHSLTRPSNNRKKPAAQLPHSLSRVGVQAETTVRSGEQERHFTHSLTPLEFSLEKVSAGHGVQTVSLKAPHGSIVSSPASHTEHGRHTSSSVEFPT